MKNQCLINFHSSPTAARLFNKIRHAVRWVSSYAVSGLFARLAYLVVLRRPIDSYALGRWREEMAKDPERFVALVNSLFESIEYKHLIERYESMQYHLHVERCHLVQSLPAARRILDLGGADPGNPRGVLLAMGYPHSFDTLTIVDMPPGASVEQKVGSKIHADTLTTNGLVKHVYRSMADLAGVKLEADSHDLVWMGQSIEHISEQEGIELLPEIKRVLRPGGWFFLDTPNGRVARLQSPSVLLHPDHKIEYEVSHLTSLILNAGFEIVEVKGIGWAPTSCQTGIFDAHEVVKNVAIGDYPEESYIQVIRARKPPFAS